MLILEQFRSICGCGAASGNDVRPNVLSVQYCVPLVYYADQIIDDMDMGAFGNVDSIPSGFIVKAKMWRLRQFHHRRRRRRRHHYLPGCAERFSVRFSTAIPLFIFACFNGTLFSFLRMPDAKNRLKKSKIKYVNEFDRFESTTANAAHTHSETLFKIHRFTNWRDCHPSISVRCVMITHCLRHHSMMKCGKWLQFHALKASRTKACMSEANCNSIHGQPFSGISLESFSFERREEQQWKMEYIGMRWESFDLPTDGLNYKHSVPFYVWPGPWTPFTFTLPQMNRFRKSTACDARERKKHSKRIIINSCCMSEIHSKWVSISPSPFPCAIRNLTISF